ncbi:MAG: PD-(D/E)XK motif protein [Nitrospirae bacterium]|nr:PD-(D/E)XK motif protein [Nitrospirota bacterium]
MMAFEARWREMPTHPEGAAFQRVDESHPLDFYLGKEASGEWALLLVTQEQPISSREYQAIHVIRRQRNDDRWALLFRLVRPELGKLFALLCEDLVEASRNIPDPARSASYVLARFARWQRLLELGHSGLLGEAALKGLIGELLFLERQAIPSRGLREAVAGWVGPAGADRDFRFPGHECEIKTILTGADRVLISSEEQLDVPEGSLDLVIVVLDEADPRSHPEAFTPLGIVERVRQVVEHDPVALETFEGRLMEAGFVARGEYGERAYVFERFRTFRLVEGFPAIRRSLLPAGIGKVTWELELRAILPFESRPATA